MKRQLIWSSAKALMLALPMLAASSAYAEGMREIIADYEGHELYAGPDNSWSPDIFVSGNLTIEKVVDDPSTPEGRKFFRITHRDSILSSWGVFYSVPRDFSQYSQADIRFWMKNPSASVSIRIISVSPTGAEVIWNLPAAGVRAGMRELVIPLAGRTPPPGFDFSRIKAPFVCLAAGTGIVYDVDHVRWTKIPTKIEIFPKAVRSGIGQQRQFTVETYDSAGNFISIPSTFVAVGGAGVMSPTHPDLSYHSILTAGSANGQIVVTKRKEASSLPPERTVLVAAADLGVQAGPVKQELGLLSETSALNLNLVGLEPNPSANSRFDFIASQDALFPTVVDDTSDYVEGSKSIKTTINLSAADQWSGWSIRWGAEVTPIDTLTRDMSVYYGGVIQFWFKGPPELADKMTVGIRSGNIPGGWEVSKDLLSKYVVFDNEWHPVMIPLKDWARSRPFADLSRIKNFFTIAVSGHTGGAKTFSIDNLRWNTMTPGPLATIQVKPNNVLVPLGSRRMFTASGVDSDGNVIDILPSWDMPAASLGTLTPMANRVLLAASNTPVAGPLRARVGSISGTAAVSVENIIPTQLFNVYSDAGIPGTTIGVSAGPRRPPSDVTLSEISNEPNTPEGYKYMRSLVNLVSNFGRNDAWGVWFIEDSLPSRYMKYYETGYLRFMVRTNTDLEIAIRSANVNPDFNRAKIRLSELGVPLNNEWQEVVVALYDFVLKEPLLRFEEMKTYFVIGTTAGILGHDATGIRFDVDNVKWLSIDSRVVDDEKIYAGLKEKIRPGGLVRSYGGAADTSLTEAYTYDQALAAMSFIYRSGQALYSSDIQFAKNIFDVYKNELFYTPFGGFGNAYHVDTHAPYNDNRSDRVAGPNAFMLLALIHYRNVTGDTSYDTVMDGIADWLRSNQDADGGILFGTSNTVPAGTKSTEHNMDVYAAFRTYARLNRSSYDYNSLAARIKNWLTTEMYDGAERRFYIGEKGTGAPDKNRALDLHAFPLLALYSNDEVLLSVEADFRNTQTSVNTGQTITGFDFGSLVCDEDSKPVDKDAVWFEGTAQMALAFKSTGNIEAGNFYLNEMTKGVYTMSASGALGLPYASNSGTPYGYNCDDPVPNHLYMDSTNAAVSSMAWYLFARDVFNPFQPSAIFSVRIKDVATHAESIEIRWPPFLNLSNEWVKSLDYVELGFQCLTKKNYVVLIYSDNKNPTHTTQFIDPTPGITNNPDSNPSGLLLVNSAASSGPDLPASSMTMPLAWTIKDSLVNEASLIAAEPNESATNPNAPQWFYIKDRQTPFIDPDPNISGDEIQPFDYSNPENYVRIGEGQFSGPTPLPHQAHYVQGDEINRGFFASSGLDYLYFEVLPNSPIAQALYKAPLYLDLLTE